MDGRRWERVLLLLAVILGVVVMHATVAPVAHELMGSGTPAAGSMTVSGVVELDGPSMSVETPGSGQTPAPMPTSHQMLNLCLAVLVAALLLGAAAVALTVLARLRRSSARVLPVVIVMPRPPPRTAVRLAQLCVLRN